MTPEAFLDRLARRRTDHVRETATVECSVCDDYRVQATYRGDPDAGTVADAFHEDADLSTCPVCGGPTEVTVE